MTLFRAKDFFNLSSFAHAAIFDEEKPVWLALQKIGLYLENIYLGKIEGTVHKSAYLERPELISIGKGSVVEPGAYIRGPCIIGDNCEVRHGAYIRGFFLAGDRCVIGHATEIKNAIFLDDAHAGHFAYIGDSILGNRVNLGAGVKCANLRLDGKNVSIVFGNKKIDSSLRKLGAILGDDVHLGCNAVTNPGVLMGKSSGCYPCVPLHGFISDHTIIKSHK